MADVILAETLGLAVPLRIDELMRIHPARRGSVAQRWAARAADSVAHHGDMLMFRTKARKRHTPECVREQRTHCDCRVGTAEIFNLLARGLAALALNPGGVTWSGLHWCVEHPGGLRTRVEESSRGALWSHPDLGCAESGYGPDDGDPKVGARAMVTIQPIPGVL